VSVYGTSNTSKQRRFSWQPDYLHYPFGRSLPVLSGFSLNGGRICLPPSLHPSTPTFVTGRKCHLCVTPLPGASVGTGILNRFSIGYAIRLRLRSRLTLIRLALIRNPWVFGGRVSHPSYRYSCLQFLFQKLHHTSRCDFYAAGMLPYHSHAIGVGIHSFGNQLMPANYRRRIARPVSYYALF
jgi:hypothetical protein